jgi:lipoprotein-anchoring transpeptidase ErfK/SrfK
VRTFTLGQVFGVWGVRLTRRCLGGYCAHGADRLRVYADGRAFTGDPRVLPLSPHAEIVVAFGTAKQLPQPLPSTYAFPPGSSRLRSGGCPQAEPASIVCRAMPARRRPVAALAAALALCAIGAPTAAARAEPPAKFPAAGELVRSAAVRSAPAASARVVRVLRRFRADAQFQIVLALGSQRGQDGAWWYRLSLPGRPNGERGWVRADAVDVRPVRNRIVVRLGVRKIEIRRLADGRLLLRAPAAIGMAGAETPLGHDFYVQSAFVPVDPFYGAYALETSASSRLTDWPDDGIVGIHGTNRPGLLGRAVSHGCVRVSNRIARLLARLAPLGTPIDIVR